MHLPPNVKSLVAVNKGLQAGKLTNKILQFLLTTFGLGMGLCIHRV